MQPACVGRLWFALEVSGKAVSVTRHWEGHSAIDKGILFVQGFKELEQKRWRDLRHPLYPDHRLALPCGVFMFNGGTFPSAVPDHAELRGSLGILPHEDVEDVKRAVSAAVSAVARSDPWLSTHLPRLTFKDVGADGAEIPAEHPIVQTVISAYRRVEDRAPEVSGRVGVPTRAISSSTPRRRPSFSGLASALRCTRSMNPCRSAIWRLPRR